MKCPRCGNEQPVDFHTKLHHPHLTPEESQRRNYVETICQICGYKWDKYDKKPNLRGKTDE